MSWKSVASSSFPTNLGYDPSFPIFFTKNGLGINKQNNNLKKEGNNYGKFIC